MIRNAWALCALACVCAAQAMPPEIASRLARLEASQRQALQARATRLRVLPPAEAAALRQRIAAWRALPIEERRARREAWLAWRALPIEQRARLDGVAAAYAALPPEERQALRAEFDALDASERRGWMLGPALGPDYPRLQPLIAQVAPEQRLPLLQRLRAMTPVERADLAAIAQRTPPQRRDALRRELLATPPAQTRAWLLRRKEE